MSPCCRIWKILYRKTLFSFNYLYISVVSLSFCHLILVSHEGKEKKLREERESERRKNGKVEWKTGIRKGTGERKRSVVPLFRCLRLCMSCTRRQFGNEYIAVEAM